MKAHVLEKRKEVNERRAAFTNALETVVQLNQKQHTPSEVSDLDSEYALIEASQMPSKR